MSPDAILEPNNLIADAIDGAEEMPDPLAGLAEKTAAYSRHVYEIAQGTGAEFGKAFEAQASDVQKKFLSAVDTAAKNAPAGSETAVAVFKSAVAAGTNALESVQKAVKQAADVAEANFNAVAAQAVNASKATVKAKRAA